jgi:hypothetical protein
MIEMHVRTYTEESDGDLHIQAMAHIENAFKAHNGAFDSHTDKGFVFKFESESDAKSFKNAINQNKYLDSDFI